MNNQDNPSVQKLTSLSNDSLATVHLHFVATKQPHLDLFISQLQLEVVIVDGDISDGFDCKKILQKTVKVTGVSNIFQTNWKIVVGSLS